MASILKVDKIRGTGLDSDTISLDGTGNITIPKNVTFSGTSTFGGSVSGAGKILQVTQATMGDRLALSTSGNFVKVTGLEASITPSSTSSKILVQCNLNVAGATGSYTCGIRLYVNDAHLSDASSPDGVYGDQDKGCWMCVCAQTWNNYTRYQASSQYLHSPSSTSQQTYSIYVTDTRDNQTIYVNRYHYQNNVDYMHTTKSNFTLMEIAG